MQKEKKRLSIAHIDFKPFFEILLTVLCYQRLKIAFISILLINLFKSIQVSDTSQ